MFFSSPPKICHPDKRSRTNKVLYVLFTESRNVLKLKYVNGQHHHPKRLSPFMSSVLKLKCKSAFGHNGNSTMTAYHILVIFSQRAKCWPNFSSSNMHKCSAKMYNCCTKFNLKFLVQTELLSTGTPCVTKIRFAFSLIFMQFLASQSESVALNKLDPQPLHC